MLALAALTKIVPVLLLPVFWWRWRWPGRLLALAVAIALLVPAGLSGGWGLGGPLDGRGLFGALRIYNRTWSFNSGLYGGLSSLLGFLRVPAADQWARMLVGLLLLVVLAIVWRAGRGPQEVRTLLRLSAVPLMAYLLLTTTVHPWYLLILLAFLPFWSPGRKHAAHGSDEGGERWWLPAPWLYLSGVVALSYLTYLVPGEARELAWVRPVEWLPVWGFVAAGAARLLRERQRRLQGITEP